MNEIILTKTFIIEEQIDNISSEPNLFKELYNELLQYVSMYVQIKYEEIPKWLEIRKNKSNLEDALKQRVLGHFSNDTINLDQYYISCKNYSSLQTNFSKVKVIFQENKYSFILFFNSDPHFFVNTIGSELIVSPISSNGEVYHIEMSDKTISIIQISNLRRP